MSGCRERTRNRKLPRQVDRSEVDSLAARSFSRYRAGGRLPSASCGRISLWRLSQSSVISRSSSATLDYDIRAYGNGVFCASSCGSTLASIGDPLNLTSVGRPGTIMAVPEPGTAALMLVGLGVLTGMVARRRA